MDGAASTAGSLDFLSGGGEMSDVAGHHVWFNTLWLSFTGRSMEASGNDAWSQDVHPDDAERRTSAYRHAFENRVRFRLDHRLRRHDGEWRTIDDSGVPRFSDDGVFLGYIGTAIDATEQRQTEAALRHSEEQLRLATDAAEVGLWDVDPLRDELFWPPRVKAMRPSPTCPSFSPAVFQRPRPSKVCRALLSRR